MQYEVQALTRCLLIVPANYCVLKVNPSKETHSYGILWHMGGGPVQRTKTIAIIEEAIAKNPQLSKGRFGLVLAYVKALNDDAESA